MRVWVTRDEEADGALSSALRARGLTAVLEPTLERRVVPDADALLGAMRRDDWLILTSPFAIRAIPDRLVPVPRVAVVGEVSRAVAESRGFRVEWVGSRGDARALFDELRRAVRGGGVWYPRSSRAAEPDPWPGVELHSPILYETVTRAYDRGVADRVDVVSVASPSAVEAVGRVDRPYASIGPTTSDALRRLGVDPWVEARGRSFTSLAEAIADHARDDDVHRA